MSHDQYGQNNPAAGGSNHDPAQAGYGQGYGQPGYGQGASAYGPGPSNSWGDPVGQRSAGYVDEGAYAQSAQSQSSAPYGQPSAQPQGSVPHSWQPQQGPAQRPPAYGAASTSGNDEDNVFKALLDFGFTRYATPGLVKVYYILGIVIGALYWLGGAVMMLITGSALSSFGGDSGNGGVAGFLWLLFGAPVFFFYVLALRVQLEMMLAMVRTNQDTRAMRATLEG